YISCKECYKEVFILIVSYSFNCIWNISKKERVSQLVLERILLLTGTGVLKKINNIDFCEKVWIEENLLECRLFQLGDKVAKVYSLEVLKTKTYSLIIDKEILLSMLIPGGGQSYFDNLILEIKDTL